MTAVDLAGARERQHLGGFGIFGLVMEAANHGDAIAKEMGLPLTHQAAGSPGVADVGFRKGAEGLGEAVGLIGAPVVGIAHFHIGISMGEIARGIAFGWVGRTMEDRAIGDVFWEEVGELIG